MNKEVRINDLIEELLKLDVGCTEMATRARELKAKKRESQNAAVETELANAMIKYIEVVLGQTMSAEEKAEMASRIKEVTTELLDLKDRLARLDKFKSDDDLDEILAKFLKTL